MMDVRTTVTRRLLALLVGAASLTASLALAQEGDAPPPPAAPPVVDDPGARLFGAADLTIDFHGFVNVEYDARGKELTPVQTFDVHNFFLASQVRIGADVTLYGELEYEHGAIVRADRVFIDWTLHPALTLRAGRFDAPLSYERTHYFAPVRLLSSRPLQVDIAFHEWSDTGLQAYGRVGLFSYALALVNGPLGLTESGIQLTDVVDNNRDKAFIGRLNATPLAGLELGAAWAQGKYDDAGRRHSGSSRPTCATDAGRSRSGASTISAGATTRCAPTIRRGRRRAAARASPATTPARPASTCWPPTRSSSTRRSSTT
jgi:hypothetical protein